MSALAPVTSSMLPGGAQDSVLLAGSNPLLAGRMGAPTGATAGLMSGMPAGSTQVGAAAVGAPPLTARIAAAVKAAVGELRGAPTSALQLPMSPVSPELAPSAAPVAAKAKPAVKAKVGTAAHAKKPAKPVAHKAAAHPAPEGSAAAAAPGVGGAPVQGLPAGTAAAVGAQGVPTGLAQLPPNATQLPGATVYSYDGNGNPAIAGLQGLPPQTQQQLGMLPGLGSMADQWGARAEQSVPQINATNQTSLPGGASPVALAGPLAPGTSTGDTQRIGTSTGAQQRVVNTNSNDQYRRDEGMGYGAGLSAGVLPYGMGSSYQSWGPSMSGVQPGTSGGFSGFLGRLFG